MIIPSSKIPFLQKFFLDNPPDGYHVVFSDHVYNPTPNVDYDVYDLIELIPIDDDVTPYMIPEEFLGTASL
jgi:hypothetical protein